MALSEKEVNEVKKILKRSPTELEYFIFDTTKFVACFAFYFLPSLMAYRIKGSCRYSYHQSFYISK